MLQMLNSLSSYGSSWLRVRGFTKYELKNHSNAGQHTEISSINLPYRETLTRLMKISGKGASITFVLIKETWNGNGGRQAVWMNKGISQSATNGGIDQTWQIYTFFPSELAELTYHSIPCTQLRFCSCNVRAARVGQRRSDPVDLLAVYSAFFISSLSWGNSWCAGGLDPLPESRRRVNIALNQANWLNSSCIIVT